MGANGAASLADSAPVDQQNQGQDPRPSNEQSHIANSSVGNSEKTDQGVSTETCKEREDKRSNAAVGKTTATDVPELASTPGNGHAWAIVKREKTFERQAEKSTKCEQTEVRTGKQTKKEPMLALPPIPDAASIKQEPSSPTRPDLELPEDTPGAAQ